MDISIIRIDSPKISVNLVPLTQTKSHIILASLGSLIV